MVCPAVAPLLFIIQLETTVLILSKLARLCRFWWVWKGGYTGPPKDSFQQFVESTEHKNFGYQDYAQRFTAELWDPDYWAKLFARSGAQYVVLTSKHHEGFCNWNSTNLHHTWNWNAMDVGPRRDLVGDLAKAVKKMESPYTEQKLHFGLYHSLFEWYNPLYRQDLEKNFTTNHFAMHKVCHAVCLYVMHICLRGHRRLSYPNTAVSHGVSLDA